MRKTLVKSTLAFVLAAQFVGVQAAEPEKLKEVVVTDVPIEENILPTSRPFNSVYGSNLSILDTPRNVTIISREQLNAISIQDVRDFSKLTSSSYTQSNFGAPSTPTIRGQIGDVFVNGMRKGLTSNGNGVPVNFNSVESVNIVKGPAGAVYGASSYVGGYVDLITKRPYFDKFQGEISATVGMYEQYRWNLDFGAPLIKDKLAFRVSYSGEESGSYYENGNKNTQAIYTALTWTPTEEFTLEFNNEFAVFDYTENWGWNRVNQALIDNGTYITGSGPGIFPNFGEPITITGVQKLSRRSRLLAPGDGSTATTYNAQLIGTYKVNPDFEIVNNSFVQYIDRNTRSSYSYIEVLKDNIAFENRTEFRFKVDQEVIAPSGGGETMKDSKTLSKAVAKDPGLTFSHDINTGFVYRYQDNINYNNFFEEPANNWDITQPRSLIRFNSVATQIPGEPANYTFFNTADTNQSQAHQFGAFFQDVLKFTDQFSLLYGGRGDAYLIHTQQPDGTIPANFAADNTSHVLANANVSPTYKPFEWMTTYFTYNFSQSRSQNNGESFSAFSSSDSYHAISELYEAGMKFNLIKDTLFMNTSIYSQTRVQTTQGGGQQQVRTKGWEAELNYQPNKNFYATLGYSLADSESTGAGAFNAYSQPFDGDGRGEFGRPVGTFLINNRYYDTPGLPDQLFNALATYKFDFGLGASAGMVVTSPIDLSYQGPAAPGGQYAQFNTATIPWQYSLDVTVFYNQPRYEVRLALLNVTDEKNFSAVNPGYGNASVSVDLPFRAELTAKFKF